MEHTTVVFKYQTNWDSFTWTKSIINGDLEVKWLYWTAVQGDLIINKNYHMSRSAIGFQLCRQ